MANFTWLFTILVVIVIAGVIIWYLKSRKKEVKPGPGMKPPTTTPSEPSEPPTPPSA